MPKPKKWWAFIADGRCISVNEESKKVQKEMARLRGLAGIVVALATDEQLIQKRAKTMLPKPMLYKMDCAAKDMARKLKKKEGWPNGNGSLLDS